MLQGTEFDFAPVAFELDYLIRVPPEYVVPNGPEWAKVNVWKNAGEPVRFQWENQSEFNTDINEVFKAGYADILLPQYVLGYSSGGNEILSLPFFKMRFIQFDEYWHALAKQLPYEGRPETRLAYLDTSFSQAILLCNLLFHDAETLRPFREEVGIEALREFRIIIKRSIEIPAEVAAQFDDGSAAVAGVAVAGRAVVGNYEFNHPALTLDRETGRYTLNLLQLLEASGHSADNFDPIVTRLQRCATCSYLDESTDTLYLDYYVNEATKQAFSENFDFDINKSPITLFQALQVLLTLNLYTVSDQLKNDLYESDSLYVGETVPTLASDQRIMRIKHFWLQKAEVEQPVLLKSLSDGEHQLLHSLGLSLLFRNTNSLFLLDEPETHFNPDWRSNFVTRLHECFHGAEDIHEMLVTTHTPFLISDSKPEKVLVFKKEDGKVTVKNPDYYTLGASINKITMNTFNKRETIGGHAQGILDELRKRFERGEDKELLLAEIDRKLGDSVEKILLIKTILDSMEARG